MNILHVYKDYHPVLGGIENHIKWLAEAQAERGHEVTVLVTSLDRHSSECFENGVRVIRAARLAHVASTPLSLSFPRLLRSQRPDIAHLHFPYPVGELSQWLLGRARKTVITYHSDVVRQQTILRFYRPLLGRVLRHADLIIPTSPQYMESSPYLRPWREKCRVVPLGIPLGPFLADHQQEAVALRREYGQPLLLCVGALRYYKGLQYLIQALPQIPRANLVIVGRGPLRAEWENIAQQQGVAKRVHFAGQVDRETLPVYYQACDLFVLPACMRSEAFGLAQVEAMASGKPVVGTELGTGTSFVNQHGETGLVVPPRDPDALAAAINELLADGERRQAMGRAARARAAAEFSLPVMVERVLAAYEEALHPSDQ
ncbi:MAG: glycosyltransferase [Chloroflexi bacterium]|nr:glycosyltransferase [Chloroflexota bacterium]